MKHLLKKLQAKTKQIKPTSIRTILAEMMAHRIQLISQLHLKATPTWLPQNTCMMCS